MPEQVSWHGRCNDLVCYAGILIGSCGSSNYYGIPVRYLFHSWSCWLAVVSLLMMGDNHGLMTVTRQYNSVTFLIEKSVLKSIMSSPTIDYCWAATALVLRPVQPSISYAGRC